MEALSLQTSSLETILEKSIKNKHPELKDSATFSIIGNDRKNPWGADTFVLTPGDILRITSQLQIPIYATPHIGLHWPSNSMYPYMGVKICDITVNQSIKDTADKPEYIGEKGVLHHCCVQKRIPVLSPYLRIDEEKFKKAGLTNALKFVSCNRISHVHHTVKKMVLGQKNVTLDIDLLSGSFVFRALEILVQNEQYILGSHTLQLFNRFVDKDGVVSETTVYDPSCHKSFLALKNAHAEMILNDSNDAHPSGYIPIVEVCIMLDALHSYHAQHQKRELSKGCFEIGDAFTVSGISMIHYLKNPRSRQILQRMYEVLQPEFCWLPRHLRLFIIPGGVFTFLPSSAETNLETSIIQVLETDAELTEINKLFSNGVSDNLIRAKKIISCNHKSRLEAYRHKITTRRGFNQYDLLNGEVVMDKIPNMLQDMSFEKIRVLFGT